MAHEDLAPLTHRIIGAAIEVHRALGPGLAERFYARALQRELQEQKLSFAAEQSVRIKYKGETLGLNRLDLIVEDAVVLELKAVYEINNFHVAQMLSYLKTGKKRLGLILNFARPRLEVKRVAL